MYEGHYVQTLCTGHYVQDTMYMTLFTGINYTIALYIRILFIGNISSLIATYLLLLCFVKLFYRLPVNWIPHLRKN